MHGRHAFHHWLTRRVAYEATLISDRRTVHRATAVELERAQADAVELSDGELLSDLIQGGRVTRSAGPVAAPLAAHWAAADQAHRSGTWRGAAADEALRRDRYADAIREAEDGGRSFAEIGDALGERFCRNATGRALERLSRYPEALERAERPAPQPDSDGADADRLAAREELLAAGVLNKLARGDESERHALEALRLSAPGSSMAAGAHAQLGLTRWIRGDFFAALAHYSASQRASEAGGETLPAASALNNVGNVHYALGELDSAFACYSESLARARAAGARFMVSAALGNCGIVHWSRGEPRESLRLQGESLEMARQLGDRQAEANAWTSLGLVHHSLGDVAVAEAAYRDGLRIQREIGDEVGISSSLINLAEIAIEASDSAGAERLLGASLEVATRTRNRPMESHALALRSVARFRAGDAAGARADAQAAARLADETSYGDGKILAAHAEALLDGDAARAETLASEAVAAGQWFHRAAALLLAAELRLAAGDVSRAVALLDEAEQVARAREMAGVLRQIDVLRRKLPT